MWGDGMCVTYALHHLPGGFRQQQPVLLLPGLPVLRVPALPPGPPLMPQPDEQVRSTCDSCCIMRGDEMCVTYALHHFKLTGITAKTTLTEHFSSQDQCV